MKTKLVLVSTILLILSACSTVRVAEARIPVYTNIPMAPNIVLTVEVPLLGAPGSDYVWVEGYWAWDYNYREYVWVQGHWTLVPYVGAYWIPGYWEYYRSGYRWIDACWLPRNYHINFGYYQGRYDYYGRPVYYHQPGNNSYGYAYSYDHRQEFRGKGYSSSPNFNEAPKEERSRINKEFRRVSTSTRASTDRNAQESIKIRNESEQQPTRESATPSRTSSSSETRTVTTGTRSSSTETRPATTGTRSSSTETRSSTTVNSKEKETNSNANTTGNQRVSNSNSNNSSSGSSTTNSRQSAGSSSSGSQNTQTRSSSSSSSSSSQGSSSRSSSGSGRR